MGHEAPRLPVGTQVVLRAAGAGADGRTVQRGATGRVATDLPDGRYIVRLADGRDVPCSRPQLALRTAYRHEVAAPPAMDGAVLVREHTIYAAVVGSRAFVSQLVYQAYSGYVLSQFKKLETDLRRDGTPKWKHVMRLLRLLLAARTLLRDGVVQVDVGPDRDRLLAVRRGERPWAEVESWRIGLHAELDQALDTTPLPPVPNVDRIDTWLRSVRARSLTPPLGTPLDHVRP